MDKKKSRRVRLWLYFSGVIFCTIMSILVLLVLLWIISYQAGAAKLNPFDYHLPLLSILWFSLLVGGCVSMAIARLLIRPIRQLGDAFEELSKGNFDVKMPTNGRLSDVREIADRFNAMAYDLAHVETLRSDFVDNVSHEFKTPLAAIEGYATLLQNPGLSREKHDYYVEKILSNTRRLTNLSANILALSKLENQETVLHKKEYLLDEQLRRAILLLEDKWSARDLELDLELEACPFYGNEKLLDQVWLNLLDNAVKHAPVGSTVAVGIRAEGGTVAVTVADQGAGMDEETQKHIFEKFYQGDSSHKAEGNGLGLALVKRIVELCQGTVAVDSAPGKGAAFTVRLPNDA